MSQRRTQKGPQRRANGTSGNGPSASPQLQTLNEMFPDWESDDLATFLFEHNNDVEIVIDLIVNNKVAKWEPIKKESKPKRKDDSHEYASSAVTTTPHQESSSKSVKHTKDRIKLDKKRDKKPFKKEAALAQHGHGHGQIAPKNTASPGAKSDISSLEAQKLPLNSWAAALGKDSKPKQREALRNNIKTQETEDEEKPTPVDQHRKSDLDQTSSEGKHGKEGSQDLSKESLTSWATAIKPRTKPQASNRNLESLEARSSSHNVDHNILNNEKPDSVESTDVQEKPASQTEDVQLPQEISSLVKESEVVLPQEVSNIGVSFGSLSLGAKEAVQQRGEQQRPSAIPPSSAAEVSHQNEAAYHDSGNDSGNTYSQNQSQETQSTQRVSQSHQHRDQLQHSKPSQQVEQSQQAEQPPQSQQPKHGYQAHDGPPQGQDYYSQFQQIQQLFPQLAAAGTLPAQFGYPGYDYTAAFGQAGIGSMSPAYFHNTIGNAGQVKGGSQTGSANAEIGESPLVQGSNIAQQHLQSSQQNQQVPGTAPFGFPNYYSYYYNTPYYGNGAGMGASAGAFGMQPQLSEGSSGSQHPSGGDNEAALAQDAPNTHAANQFYGQYYATPTQYGNRAGFHFSGYPNSQPFPQSAVQLGDPNDKQQTNHHQPLNQPQSQTQAPGPSHQQQQQQHGQPQQQQQQQQQPQHGQQQIPQGVQSQSGPLPNAIPGFPQQMPQYANYQQYPQYGGFQDNSQYRTWY